MIIDLEQVRGEVGFDLTFGPRELDRGPLERIELPEARITGSVRRGPRGFELEARLTAQLGLACSRCLAPYAETLSTAVALVLVSAAGGLDGPPDGADDDDAECYDAPGGKVELEALAVEQVYLSLPAKPLCRDDCRGLCPTCGGNRNRIECACRREAGDPRFLPLREFKGKNGAS